MTAATVDPRIRARRIAVRRQAGRRRLGRLAIVAALVAVVAAAWGLTRSPLLDVDRVRVSGAARTADEAVAEALGSGPGSPMVGVDAGGAEARLEALPWVADATVDRRWPGTLTVDITERTPVALIQTEPDDWALVDGDGRVLGPADGRTDLPRLSGLHAAGEPGTWLDDADAALELARLAPRSLDLRGVFVEDGELWMRLESGLRIRVGDDSALDLKVLASETVLDHVATEGGVVWEADVSVPTAPVVRTPEALLEDRDGEVGTLPTDDVPLLTEGPD